MVAACDQGTGLSASHPRMTRDLQIKLASQRQQDLMIIMGMAMFDFAIGSDFHISLENFIRHQMLSLHGCRCVCC